MTDLMPKPSIPPSDALTDPRRCGAKTRSGEPCTQWRVNGTNRCKMHGGASPRAVAKHKEMLLQAKVNGELQALGWEPVTDPVARYADLAGEILAFKDLAREQMNALQDWTLTIGHFQRDDDDGDSQFLAMAEQAKAVVMVYERALDRAERVLSRMQSLGITADLLREALHLELARPTMEQVEKLAAVLNRVMSDRRVSVSGDARGVVVDAMRAEGLG